MDGIEVTHPRKRADIPANATINPTRRRRIPRKILRLAIVLLCLWFAGTGVAAFFLTHRIRSPYPEPAPAVSWAKLENVRLTSSAGVGIGAWVNPAGDRPTVVLLLHGQGETRRRMLPRMAALAEHGYPSMAISFRAHGDSDGSVYDFGFHACDDVVTAVGYLRERFPNRPIVVVGNSLGSVSAIFAAQRLDHQLAGYFLESPYRDFLTAVKNRTRLAPPPFSEAAYVGLRMWGRLLLPEDAEQVRPIDHVGEISVDIPVTFVAARNDPVCRLYEVQELYRKVESHARLVVVESSRHGAIARTDPQVYYPQLFDLLAKTDATRK